MVTCEQTHCHCQNNVHILEYKHLSSFPHSDHIHAKAGISAQQTSTCTTFSQGIIALNMNPHVTHIWTYVCNVTLLE